MSGEPAPRAARAGRDPGLGDARYLSLATFRRDGREVRTPVWVAALAPRLFVFSNRDAGKVKRIRANGRARIARCDYRGRVTGEWIEAHAGLVTDPETIDAAYRAFRAKYGWRMAITDGLSKLAGRYTKRAMIALELLS